MAVFSGVVVSGRGMAGDHVSCVADELCDITRQQLYHGSLNVVLDKPLNLDSRHAVRFDHEARYLWNAMMGGHQVWLYRWKGTPYNIVEILADCRLRDVLGLVDGSHVEISISNTYVVSLSIADHLSCFMLWGLGRKYLFYSKWYKENKRIKYLRRRLGDGQM